jgi:hypothetical protein
MLRRRLGPLGDSATFAAMIERSLQAENNRVSSPWPIVQQSMRSVESIEMRDGMMRNRGSCLSTFSSAAFPNFLVRLKTRDEPLTTTKNGLFAPRQFRKGAALARSHRLNTRSNLSEMVPEGSMAVMLLGEGRMIALAGDLRRRYIRCQVFR